MQPLQQTAPLKQESPQETILRITRGFEAAQCLFVAAQLGIADLLKETPKSYDDLAAATRTDRDALSRLLRALVSMNVFAQDDAGQLHLTPLSECLLEHAPGSLRNFLLMRAEVDYVCWGQLFYSVRTGKNAFEHVFGMNRYEYHQRHPDTGERFDRAMVDLAARHHDAILAAYDFSALETVMDVGGGQGSLLAALLQRYPTLQGVLFDQAATIAKARDFLQKTGVLERCKLTVGDFFATIPDGADAYVLKQVLHNWDDAQALKILKNCRQAMAGGERLLVIELLLAPATSLHSQLVDLRMMLVMDSGRNRTEEEFRRLFEAAGFNLLRLIPTMSGTSILEGVLI